MRDMTPDELDDWLTQEHTMLVVTASLGEINVRVTCSEVTDACRHWDDCAKEQCILDDEPNDTTEHERHGLTHRWDSHDQIWKIPTEVCVTKALPLSTTTEHAILVSQLQEGASVGVVPTRFHDNIWYVDLSPETGRWGDW